jgi:predicted RNA-binding Zn ribbon-like protein
VRLGGGRRLGAGAEHGAGQREGDPRPHVRIVIGKSDQVYYTRFRLPGPLPNEWAAEPCLDLVNTRFREHVGGHQHYDRLPLTEWRRAFLEHWSYEVGDPDDPDAVARLGALRTTLRSALERYMSGRPLPPPLRRAIEAEINRPQLVLRVVNREGKDQMALERQGRPWDVVIADVAASAMRIIGDGRLVKECANPNCSWMFLDTTRTGSRRWCDVSICGSLINVRRYRASGRAYTQHSSTDPLARP